MTENELLGIGRQEEVPSEPIRLESDGIFDSAGYPTPSESDPFTEDPLAKFADRLVGGMERLMPAMPSPGPIVFTPPPAEHKVRIFRFYDKADLAFIERQIETLLNDGYSCHIPTVCGDFVIMDFSRRKESEENERKQ